MQVKIGKQDKKDNKSVRKDNEAAFKIDMDREKSGKEKKRRRPEAAREL